MKHRGAAFFLKIQAFVMKDSGSIIRLLGIALRFLGIALGNPQKPKIKRLTLVLKNTPKWWLNVDLPWYNPLKMTLKHIQDVSLPEKNTCFASTSSIST